MHGEFNNEDPVRVAVGKHLKTDWSISWTADNGKLYFFTTRTSMEFFEDSPRTYLHRRAKILQPGRSPHRRATTVSLILEPYRE
jgi:YHS domain-containing protein